MRSSLFDTPDSRPRTWMPEKSPVPYAASRGFQPSVPAGCVHPGGRGKTRAERQKRWEWGKHPASLSGGQKQLLCIALPCIKDTDIICLDAPTTSKRSLRLPLPVRQQLHILPCCTFPNHQPNDGLGGGVCRKVTDA